ncbi:MAG: hypothetical protein ACKVJC_08370 [Flavobacteriales bacterium]
MRNDLLILLSTLLLGNNSFSQVEVICEKQQIHTSKLLKYSVSHNNDNTDQYIFHVRDNEHDILFYLPLKKIKNKYGFIGTMY